MSYNMSMRTDKYGQLIFTENDLCDIFLSDPSKILKRATVEHPINFSDILELDAIPELTEYVDPNITVREFDIKSQSNWLMPDEYKNLDIAKYILSLCATEDELQRAGQELLLFQEKEMFDLLRYLKYLVDVMRKNNIVWGVGRGSSVSSFVLFLLGVHRINSLYYDLSIDEFLK